MANWTNTGNIAGTTGQSKHIEAMRIRLTGEVAQYADVYYRMHVANFGWLGWAKKWAWMPEPVGTDIR